MQRRLYRFVVLVPPNLDSLVAAIAPRAPAEQGEGEAVNRAGLRWTGVLFKGRQGWGVVNKPDGSRYIGAYVEDREWGSGALLPPAGEPLVQRWTSVELQGLRPPAGRILSARPWIFLGEGFSEGLAQGWGGRRGAGAVRETAGAHHRFRR